MKKTTFLSLFVLLLSQFFFPVFGQSKSSLGVVVGVSQSWDIDSDHSTLVTIPGFHIGINSRIALAKNIHFQPEIALVNRIMGYYNTQTNAGIKTESASRSSITMLQIPLSVQFGRKIYFGFGLCYGFPLISHTRVKTSITSNGTTETKTTHATAEWSKLWSNKPFDLALCIGSREGRLGWEIRPSISSTMNPNFWAPEEFGSAILHLTGIVVWQIK